MSSDMCAAIILQIIVGWSRMHPWLTVSCLRLGLGVFLGWRVGDQLIAACAVPWIVLISSAVVIIRV